MKKTKLWTLLALMLVFAMQSCKDNFSDDFASKNVTPDVQVVGDRLFFKDNKTYETTLDRVSKMTQNEFNTWRNAYKFPALYNTKRDSFNVNPLKDLPHWYQAVMNSNGELIVGDTIVWFTKTGDIHYIPKMNQSELANIKSGASSNFKKETWEITTIQIPKDKAARMNLSGSDARWQQQFYYLHDSGSLRKWVFELQNIKTGTQYQAVINMKEEWLGSVSNQWQTAHEYRNYRWDVTINASLFGGQLTGTTPKDDEIYNRDFNGWYGTDNFSFPLVTDYSSIPFSAFWNIDVQGDLYAQIVDNFYPDFYDQNGQLW